MVDDFSTDVHVPEFMKKLVNEVLGELKTKMTEVDVSKVKITYVTNTESLGVYVSGTFEAPEILLNLSKIQSTCQKNKCNIREALESTLTHEIYHAIQDKQGKMKHQSKDAIEKEAEDFTSKATIKEDRDTKVDWISVDNFEDFVRVFYTPQVRKLFIGIQYANSDGQKDTFRIVVKKGDKVIEGRDIFENMSQARHALERTKNEYDAQIKMGTFNINESILNEGFEEFVYQPEQVPNKEFLMADFYVINSLPTSIEVSATKAPLLSEDLLNTIIHTKRVCYQYLRKHLLSALYYALSCEFRHAATRANCEQIAKELGQSKQLYLYKKLRGTGFGSDMDSEEMQQLGLVRRPDVSHDEGGYMESAKITHLVWGKEGRHDFVKFCFRAFQDKNGTSSFKKFEPEWAQVALDYYGVKENEVRAKVGITLPNGSVVPKGTKGVIIPDVPFIDEKDIEKHAGEVEKFYKGKIGEAKDEFVTVSFNGFDDQIVAKSNLIILTQGDIETTKKSIPYIDWGGNGSSYGGNPWARIAEAWLDLYDFTEEGDITTIPHIIDRVYDLQHNNSTVFTKVKSYYDSNQSFAWVMKALDYKFYASAPQLIDKCSHSLASFARHVLYMQSGETLEQHLLNPLVKQKEYWNIAKDYNFENDPKEGDEVVLALDVKREDSYNYVYKYRRPEKAGETFTSKGFELSRASIDEHGLDKASMKKVLVTKGFELPKGTKGKLVSFNETSAEVQFDGGTHIVFWDELDSVQEKKPIELLKNAPGDVFTVGNSYTYIGPAGTTSYNYGKSTYNYKPGTNVRLVHKYDHKCVIRFSQSDPKDKATRVELTIPYKFLQNPMTKVQTQTINKESSQGKLYPIGTKVVYNGTGAKEYQGKQAVVTAYSGDNYTIKFDSGYTYENAYEKSLTKVGGQTNTPSQEPESYNKGDLIKVIDKYSKYSGKTGKIKSVEHKIAQVVFGKGKPAKLFLHQIEHAGAKKSQPTSTKYLGTAIVKDTGPHYPNMKHATNMSLPNHVSDSPIYEGDKVKIIGEDVTKHNYPVPVYAIELANGNQFFIGKEGLKDIVWNKEEPKSNGQPKYKEGDKVIVHKPSSINTMKWPLEMDEFDGKEAVVAYPIKSSGDNLYTEPETGILAYKLTFNGNGKGNQWNFLETWLTPVDSTQGGGKWEGNTYGINKGDVYTNLHTGHSYGYGFKDANTLFGIDKFIPLPSTDADKKFTVLQAAEHPSYPQYELFVIESEDGNKHLVNQEAFQKATKISSGGEKKQSNDYMDEVGKLLGVPPNVLPPTWEFTLKNGKQIGFGYVNGPLGADIGYIDGDQPESSEEMDSSHATAQEQVDWIKQIIASNGGLADGKVLGSQDDGTKKPGDTVKIVNTTIQGWAKYNDKIGVIQDLDTANGKPFCHVKMEDGKVIDVWLNEVEKVEKEEDLLAQLVGIEDLKVGDVVEVVKGGSGIHPDDVGKKAKITQVGGKYGDIDAGVKIEPLEKFSTSSFGIEGGWVGVSSFKKVKGEQPNYLDFLPGETVKVKTDLGKIKAGQVGVVQVPVYKEMVTVQVGKDISHYFPKNVEKVEGAGEGVVSKPKEDSKIEIGDEVKVVKPEIEPYYWVKEMDASNGKTYKVSSFTKGGSPILSNGFSYGVNDLEKVSGKVWKPFVHKYQAGQVIKVKPELSEKDKKHPAGWNTNKSEILGNTGTIETQSGDQDYYVKFPSGKSYFIAEDWIEGLAIDSGTDLWYKRSMGDYDQIHHYWMQDGVPHYEIYSDNKTKGEFVVSKEDEIAPQEQWDQLVNGKFSELKITQEEADKLLGNNKVSPKKGKKEKHFRKLFNNGDKVEVVKGMLTGQKGYISTSHKKMPDSQHHMYMVKLDKGGKAIGLSSDYLKPLDEESIDLEAGGLKDSNNPFKVGDFAQYIEEDYVGLHKGNSYEVIELVDFSGTPGIKVIGDDGKAIELWASRFKKQTNDTAEVVSSEHSTSQLDIGDAVVYEDEDETYAPHESLGVIKELYGANAVVKFEDMEVPVDVPVKFLSFVEVKDKSKIDPTYKSEAEKDYDVMNGESKYDDEDVKGKSPLFKEGDMVKYTGASETLKNSPFGKVVSNKTNDGINLCLVDFGKDLGEMWIKEESLYSIEDVKPKSDIQEGDIVGVVSGSPYIGAQGEVTSSSNDTLYNLKVTKGTSNIGIGSTIYVPKEGVMKINKTQEEPQEKTFAELHGETFGTSPKEEDDFSTGFKLGDEVQYIGKLPKYKDENGVGKIGKITYRGKTKYDTTKVLWNDGTKGSVGFKSLKKVEEKPENTPTNEPQQPQEAPKQQNGIKVGDKVEIRNGWGKGKTGVVVKEISASAVEIKLEDPAVIGTKFLNITNLKKI